MRQYFFLILTFSFFQLSAQPKLNFALKKDLDSIFFLHNMYRDFVKSKDIEKKADSMMKAHNFKRSEEMMDYLINRQKQFDSSNIVRIKAIVRQYGYPGKSLVGTPTNEVAVYVLENYLYDDPANFQPYISILQKATEANELPFKLYAPVLDKSLMSQGKEQIYGTQMKAIDFPMGKTGLKGIKTIVWPIKDATNVNERRKAIGINETVEEMAKRSKVIYQVYTLDDVKKLQGN